MTNKNSIETVTLLGVNNFRVIVLFRVIIFNILLLIENQKRHSVTF